MSSGSDDNTNFQGKDDRVQSLRQLAKCLAVIALIAVIEGHVHGNALRRLQHGDGSNCCGQYGERIPIARFVRRHRRVRLADAMPRQI